MELNNEYASRAAGTAGVTLGSIATALAGVLFLNNTNLLGNKNTDPSCAPVTRYEMEQAAKIAELQTEVKLRDSNIYSDNKMLDLYKYVDGKFAAVEQELCAQRVYNATNTAAIACINNQIATLMSLTKVVIPNGSVCPGWGNVTVAPATTTTP